MTLRTAFTERLRVAHPIALAPMGGVAGGALAAAVSNAGGLGLLGAGTGDPQWVDPELATLEGRTAEPWGIGFLSWGADPDVVARALRHRPAAVLLSFGDPAPFVDLVRQADATLMVQVTSLAEARRALDVGADVIVAQGGEAGGHGGSRGTLPFVPAVVDLAGRTPVLAAGGIADGRGLAAALVLGAAGALIGTRFEASREALISAAETDAILQAGGDDTDRSRIIDIARDSPWPAQYLARTLRTPFIERWRGREHELAADPEARAAYVRLREGGDRSVATVWAGEAVDLIGSAPPAGDLVAQLAADAEAALVASVRAVRR